jgi:hypothetical protein
MKKYLLLVIFFSLVLTNEVFSQVRVSSNGSPVYFKNTPVFNIVSTDYGGINTEYVITSLSGTPLLAFIPFKIQNGWAAESYDSKYGSSQSSSGTSYTYFYRVAATSGEFCDIPSQGLRGTRGIAYLIIGFGLIKDNALDLTVFQQFCAMHGKVHEQLKYFK